MMSEGNSNDVVRRHTTPERSGVRIMKTTERGERRT